MLIKSISRVLSPHILSVQTAQLPPRPLQYRYRGMSNIPTFMTMTTTTAHTHDEGECRTEQVVVANLSQEAVGDAPN